MMQIADPCFDFADNFFRIRFYAMWVFFRSGSGHEAGFVYRIRVHICSKQTMAVISSAVISSRSSTRSSSCRTSSNSKHLNCKKAHHYHKRPPKFKGVSL